MIKTLVAVMFSLGVLQAQIPNAGPGAPDSKAESRAIFKELVEINTTYTHGITQASQALRTRFLAAGFPADDVKLLGPTPTTQNLVVRYPAKAGSTLKPMLIICHLDVVEAKKEDWADTDPFVFTEKDGYFYGRGTIDMKNSDAAAVAAFLRMKREGYTPEREMILALTDNEEGGGAINGVEWLLKNHPEVMKAEFVLNPDAGGLVTDQGKPLLLNVEATEKTYADYMIYTTSPGGHSSEPMPGNAIYRLASALRKIEGYEFPFELNEVTRAEFAATAKLEKGQDAADRLAVLKTPPDAAAVKRLSAKPSINPSLRTTCVATMLRGGHAPNALPGSAEANINCRILPGHTQEEVRKTLIQVIGDKDVTVKYKSDTGVVSDMAPDRKSAPPPPLMPAVFDPLKQVVSQMWPNLAIVPGMEAGASDSIYTTAAGMPSYGVSGMGMDKDENRAHGRDERIKVSDFDAGVTFFYLYLKAVAK